MKVLLVCNGLLKGNGVRTAILSLKAKLLDKGLYARIMACSDDDKNDIQPDFPLEHFVFPVFERMIYTNGFRYAKIDKALINKAVAWADIVHIMEGFPLEAAVVKMW